MQTTVVLGWPIEQAALSEFVPTPDESLIISLVSPILLSNFVAYPWKNHHSYYRREKRMKNWISKLNVWQRIA